jgi:hypothetical protein
VTVNLEAAVRASELIRQAQGLLMERERIPATEAFHVLRRASQQSQRQARDVAHKPVAVGGSGDAPPPRSARQVEPAVFPGGAEIDRFVWLLIWHERSIQ